MSGRICIKFITGDTIRSSNGIRSTSSGGISGNSKPFFTASLGNLFPLLRSFCSNWRRHVVHIQLDIAIGHKFGFFGLKLLYFVSTRSENRSPEKESFAAHANNIWCFSTVINKSEQNGSFCCCFCFAMFSCFKLLLPFSSESQNFNL